MTTTLQNKAQPITDRLPIYHLQHWDGNWVLRYSKQAGRLYLITTLDLYPVKVGYTTEDNVAKRLSSIQTGNWKELGVYATLWHPRVKDLEGRAHELLAPYRTLGEWFDMHARTAYELIWAMRDI